MADIEVFAAGGVIVEKDRVLLIHRPRYGDWTFPKGKLEAGETMLEAGLREVAEETGLTCEASSELASVHYRDHKGRSKEVRYWLMTGQGGEFVQNDEVDEIRWVTPDEARGLLTYTHDLGVLDALQAHNPTDR